MRTAAIASLLAPLVLLAGCTSSEPEHAAVDQELLRPESPLVMREGIRSDQTDPSRAGNCAQLSSDSLRDCLERAQYQPKNAQGMVGEPATRRQDPDQVDPEHAGRQQPRQAPEPDYDQRDDHP